MSNDQPIERDMANALEVNFSSLVLFLNFSLAAALVQP